MDLTILTPHRKLIEGETIDELIAPGFKGQLDIFPGHANLVSELETGIIRWRQGAKWGSGTVSYGWLEIQNQHVTILADVSELVDDLDPQRAKAAELKARKKIEEGGLSDEDLRKWELKLARAISRVTASGS